MEWACEVCTFAGNVGSACEVCGAPAPAPSHEEGGAAAVVAAAAAAAAAAAGVTEEWACEVCTFAGNGPRARACEVCGSRRPPGAAPPPPAAAVPPLATSWPRPGGRGFSSDGDFSALAVS